MSRYPAARITRPHVGHRPRLTDLPSHHNQKRKKQCRTRWQTSSNPTAGFGRLSTTCNVDRCAVYYIEDAHFLQFNAPVVVDRDTIKAA